MLRQSGNKLKELRAPVPQLQQPPLHLRRDETQLPRAATSYTSAEDDGSIDVALAHGTLQKKKMRSVPCCCEEGPLCKKHALLFLWSPACSGAGVCGLWWPEMIRMSRKAYLQQSVGLMVSSLQCKSNAGSHGYLHEYWPQNCKKQTNGARWLVRMATCWEASRDRGD